MKPTILIVDDEPDVCELFGAALRSTYDVVTADSASGALDALMENDVRLIVCDHVLMGMDGAELLSRIREEFPHVARVMISGTVDAETATALVAAGTVHACFEKPMAPRKLRTVVADTLNRRVGGQDVH